MRFFLAACVMALVGCAADSKNSAVSAQADSCARTWTQVDQYGNLKAYKSYTANNGQCLTENVALTHWQETNFNWTKNNVHCNPVTGFSSRTLVASGNYYSPRDNNVYLDLNSATGIYRRLVLAQDSQGNAAFTRLQGCFYVKTDATYGTQLLLDVDITKVASSQVFDPMEIFTVSTSGLNTEMIRYDDISTWSWQECPTLKTPNQFCTTLRNGNEMYFPNLTTQQETDLYQEALLIRKTFSYSTSSQGTFNSMWNALDNSGKKELDRSDYITDMIALPDVPQYIDQAWRSYVMGATPSMPDTSSSTVPPICYPGSQTVTLGNGNTGKVYGEICYSSDGTYTFTQN